MSDLKDVDEEEAFVDVINLLKSDALNYGDHPVLVFKRHSSVRI
jgi:hypothetical protein